MNYLLEISTIFRIFIVFSTIGYIIPRQIQELIQLRREKDKIIEMIGWILFGFTLVYLIAVISSLFTSYCRTNQNCDNGYVELGVFVISSGFLIMNVFGIFLYKKDKPSKEIKELIQKKEVK